MVDILLIHKEVFEMTVKKNTAPRNLAVFTGNNVMSSHLNEINFSISFLVANSVSNPKRQRPLRCFSLIDMQKRIKKDCKRKREYIIEKKKTVSSRHNRANAHKNTGTVAT